MYRIYDKPEAIKRVQIYLAEIKENDPFIAPSGIYDEITKNAVRNFQEENGIPTTGIVNNETFEKLFFEYSMITKRKRINSLLNSFVSFPIEPEQYAEELFGLHRIMARVLDYYGKHHNLRESNFYSPQTSEAVKMLREIYLLDSIDQIDEFLYSALIRDHDSMEKVISIFP